MEIARLLESVPRGGLWIFGYGSLMWSPGFRYSIRTVGLVHGYHRAPCILSHRYRGTPRRPGLVMGLCRGGSCWGMAFRVAAGRERRVLNALWKREMMNRVYVPRFLKVRLRRPGRGASSGRNRVVRALAFVADPDHRQYVRELDLHSRARLVAQGVGERGRCVDYVRNTLEHMARLELRDPHLERVLHVAHALRRMRRPAR
jgi:cation transport protein ChaC